MQKARVITRFPENAEGVADQLRSCGYDVEIAAPGEAEPRSVDLEIEMESCDSTKALDRAAELAREDGSDVYVAAGCFPEKNLAPSAAVAIATPPVIADTVNGVAAGLQNKRDLLAKALREQRAMMREARLAQRQRREEEAARHTAQQVERERLEEQAEILRRAEELKRIAVQQDEEAAMRRIARAEQTMRERALRRAESRRPDVRVVTRRTHEWRIAFAIATVFAAVLTLGWSASTRTPASPLSRELVNGHVSVEQQTPFGPAIIKATPVNPLPTLNVEASPVAKPSAVPAPKRGKRPTADDTRETKHLKREHTIRAHRAEADSDVAENAVRHVTPTPSQPRTQPPQNASLKRYSDMN